MGRNIIERLIQMYTQQAPAITTAHKEQFAKPLLTLMRLSELHLTQKELEDNADFQQAISQLREIDRQGLKQQLLSFTNELFGVDIF